MANSEYLENNRSTEIYLPIQKFLKMAKMANLKNQQINGVLGI